MHHAVNKGHTDITKLLIKYNADVNAKNEKGRTLLFNAVYNGNIDIVRLLIENGADPNGTSFNKCTLDVLDSILETNQKQLEEF